MSKTVFACTHIEKRVEDDSYEDGCDPDTCRTIISECCHIEDETIGGLLAKIGSRYFIDIKDVFVPDVSGEVTHLMFNRLENADSEEPTEAELALWRKDEKVLYLADYVISIEKMVKSSFEKDEIKALLTAAGLNTND